MRSHSNAHALFHSGIILPLLLAAAAASPFATAQVSGDSTSPDFSYSDFSPSMAVVIVVLVSAFFLMAFLSVYIRYCADESSESVNLRQAAAAARLRQPRGLDPEVIETFPIFHYSEVKDSKIDKGALECAVCIAEFENDETLRLLPKCNHVFHPECIDAWLASHTTCPVCRANLSPPSPDELGAQGTESTQPNDSAGLGEATSQSENQYQVSIDITDEVLQRQLSDVPRRDRKREGRFSRSHSTGHSLVQLEVNSDRFTLRLPEELRRQILKRTTSCCVVVLPTTEGSSRRGEGSGRGRQVGRSDREVRSDRWVFSMTPPFFSRARLVASPKVGFEGDVTAVGGSSKLFLTSVKTPFDCLAVKSDGVEQTSTLPPV